MMESILEKYEKELENGEITHITLSKIFCEMFDRNRDQKVMSVFGKLCKVYPKKQILLALLDMYDMENIDFNNNWYGLITYFIKTRLDKKVKQNNEVDLTNYVKEMEKKMRRKGE